MMYIYITGVSGKDKSWYEIIQESIEDDYTQEDFKNPEVYIYTYKHKHTPPPPPVSPPTLSLSLSYMYM